MPELEGAESKLAVVLAGGGCRAFWGAGLLHALGDGLGEVSEWAGVSAGAAVAVGMAVGRMEKLFEVFVRKTGANPKNVYLERLWTRQSPVFPHEQIYRSTIRESLEDVPMDVLHTGPDVRILLAYVLPGYPPTRTGLRALGAYMGRRRAGGMHGPKEPLRGLGWEVARARDLPTHDDVVETVLRSSTSPPITRIPHHEGRTYLDGGLVDNVPLRALTPEARLGRVLVLLTRQYPARSLPDRRGRLYLQPSEPIAVDKWDYANPEGVRAAWDLGKRDAGTYAPALRRLLDG